MKVELLRDIFTELMIVVESVVNRCFRSTSVHNAATLQDIMFLRPHGMESLLDMTTDIVLDILLDVSRRF